MTPRSAVLTRREAAAFVDHTPPQAIHLTHDEVLSTDRGETEMLPYAHAVLALSADDPQTEKLQLALLAACEAWEDGTLVLWPAWSPGPDCSD